MHTSFLTFVNNLFYSEKKDKSESIDANDIVKIIFGDLASEAVDNYETVFKTMPIDQIQPAVLLPYLPPGKTTSNLSDFFIKVKQMVDAKIFRKVFIKDHFKIFEWLSVEYLYVVNQPGKALVLLMESQQAR